MAMLTNKTALKKNQSKRAATPTALSPPSSDDEDDGADDDAGHKAAAKLVLPTEQAKAAPKKVVVVAKLKATTAKGSDAVATGKEALDLKDAMKWNKKVKFEQYIDKSQVKKCSRGAFTSRAYGRTRAACKSGQVPITPTRILMQQAYAKAAEVYDNSSKK